MDGASGRGPTNLICPMKTLINYEWPGNVRELENIIERMVILSEGDYLTIEDLPEKIADKELTDQMEETLISEDGFSFTMSNMSLYFSGSLPAILYI